MAGKEYYEEIVTKGLRIVDDEERTRAVVATATDGATEFSLFDESQAKRISVQTDRTGASMTLQDNKGMARIGLALLDSTNEPALLVLDERGAPRIQIFLRSDTPRFAMSSKANEQRLLLSVQEDLPYIRLSNGKIKNTANVIIAAQPEAGGTLTLLHDEDRFTVLGINDEGEQSLMFLYKDEGVGDLTEYGVDKE